MGKKKRKKTVTTVTTKNEVIKFSYLQTLAVYQDTLSVSDLESAGSVKTATPKDTKSRKNLGLTKKSTKVNTQINDSGIKVKDQWLQPYYDRIRYGIGVKELSVSRYKFSETAEFISVPFISPKEIIKVYTVVDEYIPEQFDQNQTWIKYYIKAEGTSEWIRINPSNVATKFDIAGEIVPKIINFNIPKPTTAQLEDKYNTTDDPVKKIRFRAVLSRPTGGNLDSITPMVKSYRVLMIPREQ